MANVFYFTKKMAKQATVAKRLSLSAYKMGKESEIFGIQ